MLSLFFILDLRQYDTCRYCLIALYSGIFFFIVKFDDIRVLF